MAESDASESSVLVDFSDQIGAELSEEGGSICRAESVPVQPYRHEPYRLDGSSYSTLINLRVTFCDKIEIAYNK